MINFIGSFLGGLLGYFTGYLFNRFLMSYSIRLVKHKIYEKDNPTESINDSEIKDKNYYDSDFWK